MPSSSKQTVMIVGQGAREHVLSVAYEKSDEVGRIVMAPGNDFHTWQRDKEVIREPKASIFKPESILEAAKHHKVDVVDVAQDDALAAGTVDLLEQNNIRAFGPSREASQIEWDKAWARQFMDDNHIPAPAHRAFIQDDKADAAAYLAELYADDPERLVFVKAAGLCFGKGALSARSRTEAAQRIEQLKSLGKAGDSFVIEEGLVGEEFSYTAISDGTSFKTFPSAQDNKLSEDRDQGEQTGGIGATSPTALTETNDREIRDRMIAPAIDGLRQAGRPFKGILYLGGIVTKSGFQTIEYNARWGDPEVQVILPGLHGDYFALTAAATAGNIDQVSIQHDGLTRVCVVGASKGYPGDYSSAKGCEITGLQKAKQVPGVNIYGAAIAIRGNKFYADGGRLFSAVGEGHTVQAAQERAYEAIRYISIDGDNLHYRTDIGDKERRRRE